MTTIATPFAHHTCRIAELVRLFGHVAGGRVSERLMARLAMAQAGFGDLSLDQSGWDLLHDLAGVSLPVLP